jgi:predicted transcriptional regulator
MTTTTDNKAVAAELAAAIFAKSNSSSGVPVQDIVKIYREVLATLDNVDAAEAKLRTDAWLSSMVSG